MSDYFGELKLLCQYYDKLFLTNIYCDQLHTTLIIALYNIVPYIAKLNLITHHTNTLLQQSPQEGNSAYKICKCIRQADI